MRVLLLLVFLAGAPAAQAQTCAPRSVPAVNSCASSGRVTLAIVGDVLLHRALQWRGYARGFDTIWGAATPLLRSADIAIANLEGPVAAGFTRSGRREADPGPVFDDHVYSGYPTFNYHPVILPQLRAAGIDIVTTANNHALDRGSAGLDATLAALSNAGLAQTGAVPGGSAGFVPLRLRTRVGRLSLIACTFGTNGVHDPRGQVPLCYADRARLLRRVAEEAATGAGVLVLPHWGQEYRTRPDAQQRQLARDLAAAGAMAVVGTHPHVVQPWDMLNGPTAAVPILYSTGNFVAAQPPLERATSLMAWLALCESPTGPRVAEAGFVPLQMEFDGADPSLTLPHPGLSPQADAGLALLRARIPGRDLSAALECHRRPAATAPPDR